MHRTVGNGPSKDRHAGRQLPPPLRVFDEDNDGALSPGEIQKLADKLNALDQDGDGRVDSRELEDIFSGHRDRGPRSRDDFDRDDFDDRSDRRRDGPPPESRRRRAPDREDDRFDRDDFDRDDDRSIDVRRGRRRTLTVIGFDRDGKTSIALTVTSLTVMSLTVMTLTIGSIDVQRAVPGVRPEGKTIALTVKMLIAMNLMIILTISVPLPLVVDQAMMIGVGMTGHKDETNRVRGWIG